MTNYLDDETLTSNLDDPLASRVYKFLEDTEKNEPEKLDFWIYLIRFWNDFCQNKMAITLFEKFLTVLEARYAQK